MSRADLELAWNQTQRLEASGIVLHDSEVAKRMGELIPEKKAGRPKLYQTEAEKKKAYRERRAAKTLAELDGHRTATPEKVTDSEKTEKSHAQNS